LFIAPEGSNSNVEMARTVSARAVEVHVRVIAESPSGFDPA